MKSCFSFVFLALAALVTSLKAEPEVYTGQPLVAGEEYLLAAWNFNDVTAPPGSQLDVSHGTGELTTNWEESGMTDFAGTTLNRFGSDAAGRDLALRNGADSLNQGRHLDFRLDLTNFEDLTLSYATRRSSSGFTEHQWWWSPDGENFSHHSTIPVPENYATQTVDFSEMTSLNGNDAAHLRLVVTGLPEAPAATGNNRFDNVQFRGRAAIGTAAPGAVVLTNVTAGSPLAGKYLFVPDEIQSLAITLNGEDSDLIESVRLSLPESWSGITFDEVALSGPGFGAASVEVLGATVTISGALVNDASPGTVTWHGITVPGEAIENYGHFTIAVETAATGEALKPIARQPYGFLVIPVAAIRPVDEHGVALALGQRVAISGVATVGSGQFHNERFLTFLQDETAGVALDHPSLSQMSPGATAGWRYTAIGTVGQFRGLTRIELEAKEDFIFIGAGVMPEPKVRTIAEVLSGAEMLEGSLLRVRRVSRTGASEQWPSPGVNGVITLSDDAEASQLAVLLNRFTDISWMPEPSYPIDVVGILGQSRMSAPFTSGYELLPRSSSDFLPASDLEEGYKKWRRERFLEGLENEAISGPGADPDGDGIVNLLEYALGGDPWTNSSYLLPKTAWVEGRLAIVFRRVNEATDVIYVVEASSDLVGWTEIWSSEDFPYDSPGPLVEETVVDWEPSGGITRRFLRLVVTER